MSRDEPDPGVPAGSTSTEGKDSGKLQDEKATPGKSIKPLKLENVVADWKNLGNKVRDLNQKINQDVLKNVEKLENIHYQNMKNADAVKLKIEQDWGAFEAEVKNGIENIKKLGQQNTERTLQDLNAKKEEIQVQVKTWEKNYQEWSTKTGKKVSSTLASWSRFGWKVYLTFLVVAIPIVIIIVVLADALR
jgi:pyruvate-formate lyase-activating enzyme